MRARSQHDHREMQAKTTRTTGLLGSLLTPGPGRPDPCPAPWVGGRPASVMPVFTQFWHQLVGAPQGGAGSDLWQGWWNSRSACPATDQDLTHSQTGTVRGPRLKGQDCLCGQWVPQHGPDQAASRPGATNAGGLHVTGSEHVSASTLRRVCSETARRWSRPQPRLACRHTGGARPARWPEVVDGERTAKRHPGGCDHR